MTVEQIASQDRPFPRTCFVVGDIHGRLDPLQSLLARLEAADPAAQLVFLGDYGNRGGQTREVLDLLLALQQARPDTVFLLGNHEAALLRYDESRSSEDLQFLRAMGFQATLDSYGPVKGPGLQTLPQAHRDFLHSLRPCWRRAGYLCFHAPLPAEVDPEGASAEALEVLLTRRTVDAKGWAARHARTGETLVFGHVSLETPLVVPGLIGIDTLAAGLLTALELPTLRFHHACADTASSAASSSRE